MISIVEAVKILEKNTSQLATETVVLENAVGRILAEEIDADMDLPPFDRSQMDGYALKTEDALNVPAKIKIIGESAAGKSWTGELKSGEAVRIMTGAAVPKGADAVQKLEVTKEENESVEVFEPVKIGQNIVAQASEIQKGTVLFRPGARLTRQMVASLASFGYAKVLVGTCPRVAILATGNEIVPVDQTPANDQIRDSNTATLQVYAEAVNATVNVIGQVGDDLESLKRQIERAVESNDVLILSGGVSVGKYDFTKMALRELGAEIFFDKVALRPGKPTVFARLGETLVFGLPGNPVSVIVTFNLFARAALLKMQGAGEVELKTGFAVLTKDLKGVPTRDSYLPAKLATNERGQLLAEPIKWGGSSDFVAFARADALVFVPSDISLAAQSAAQIVFLD